MSAHKNIYVFIGPPGSGKGTLAQLAVQQYGWAQLSTGNLCRKHIADQTEIGKQIDLIIKSGKLISDELVTCMVDEWLAEQPIDVSIILDGYPRTVEQAKRLDKLLQQKYADATLTVVVFDIDDAIVIERMSARLTCTNKKCQSVFSTLPGSPCNSRVPLICDRCQERLEQRADDDPRVIKKRLIAYHEHDLLPYYLQAGARIVHINAEQLLSKAFDEFKHELGLSAS